VGLRISGLERVKCYPTLSESQVLQFPYFGLMTTRLKGSGSPSISFRLGSVYTCLSIMTVAKFGTVYYIIVTCMSDYRRALDCRLDLLTTLTQRVTTL
jgi:hypothetical protein